MCAIKFENREATIKYRKQNLRAGCRRPIKPKTKQVLYIYSVNKRSCVTCSHPKHLHSINGIKNKHYKLKNQESTQTFKASSKQHKISKPMNLL